MQCSSGQHKAHKLHGPPKRPSTAEQPPAPSPSAQGKDPSWAVWQQLQSMSACSAKKNTYLGETKHQRATRLHLWSLTFCNTQENTFCSLHQLQFRDPVYIAGNQRLCPGAPRFTGKWGRGWGPAICLDVVLATLVSAVLHSFELDVFDTNSGKAVQRIQMHWVLWQHCELGDYPTRDYPKESTSHMSEHGNAEVWVSKEHGDTVAEKEWRQQ